MLLREARTRETGLLDLLAWDVLLDEGLLRNVDGALAAVLEYRGPDLDSATAEELSALSRTVLGALDLLGTGWMVHADAVRLPAPPYPTTAHFPDPATRGLDDERRRRYAQQPRFTTRYYLTLTYLRPKQEAKGLALLRAPLHREHLLDREAEEIGAFEERVGEIRRLLATRFEVQRLGTADLVRYLHTALTGRDQPVQVSPHLVTLESLFGAGELHGGLELRMSEHHLVPITLINFPSQTTPAALAFLDDLPVPYRAVMRLICMDRYAAKAAIASVRQQWATAGVSLRHLVAVITGGSGAEPRFADRLPERMAQDADDAVAELDEHETSAGYLSTTILTWHTDRRQAMRQADEIVKELRARGFVALVETYNAVEAFLGALPGHGSYNCRRPIVSYRSFVDLMPTTAVWAGQVDNPHPALAGQGPCVVAATGSTPFAWSLASQDVQHALVAGPIGAGKSTLVNLLMAQYLRYRDAQVFSFDKGGSQVALCRAAGGHHYAPEPDREDTERFAPLAHIDRPVDRSRATDWLEDLLQLQGLEIDPRRRRLLHRAVELLAATPRRTLAAFAAKVQDREIREALAPYVGDGPLAHLFGGERSALRDGHLHVIEMESLLHLRRKALAPAITHLFYEIERRLDGRPTLIVVEEAPNYLQDTLFARKFREWLLELRKKNTGVILVTQLLTSLLESDLRDAILENCPTRVFLPNAAAQAPHAREAYRAFGLNDRQVGLIAEATGKRDYYLDTPEGSRMIQLGLGEGELEVLTGVGREG